VPLPLSLLGAAPFTKAVKSAAPENSTHSLTWLTRP